MGMPGQFTLGHGSLGVTSGVLSNYFDLLFLLAGPKSPIVHIINDTLRQSVPCVSQALLQIVHVSNWRLINIFLHKTSYSIVYGVKIRTIWRP